MGPVKAAENFRPSDGARNVGVNKFLSAVEKRAMNLQN
jgi:hypothetical protein